MGDTLEFFHCDYHGKAVSNPEASPPPGTVRDLCCLTVNSDDVRWSVTDHTSGDVLCDLRLCDWHHRDGRRCGQPVRFVIAAGIVAHVIEVAEDERHSAEPLQT